MQVLDVDSKYFTARMPLSYLKKIESIFNVSKKDSIEMEKNIKKSLNLFNSKIKNKIAVQEVAPTKAEILAVQKAEIERNTGKVYSLADAMAILNR